MAGIEITKLSYNEDLEFKPVETKGEILYVTDSNVYKLDLTKKFFSQFKVKTVKNKGAKFLQGSSQTDSKAHLIVIPAGEKYKSMDTVLQISAFAQSLNFSRKSRFAAIGGGVTTDLTGFAAAIYKRGISVDFYPTTLLSMADAAVGGKTGCDFGSLKNTLGSFWCAENICMNTQFLTSLPQKEFISGLGEVIKTGLLFDNQLVNFFEENSEKILSRDVEILKTPVKRSAELKLEVVKKDLREENIRAFLNLGHTFGHALETTKGLGKITHGEAVAWGISRAAKLSLIEGLCDTDYYNRVINLLEKFGYDTNPVTGAKQIQNIIQAMKNDKKNNDTNSIRFVLQKNVDDNLTKEVSVENIIKSLSEK